MHEKREMSEKYTSLHACAVYKKGVLKVLSRLPRRCNGMIHVSAVNPFYQL